VFGGFWVFACWCSLFPSSSSKAAHKKFQFANKQTPFFFPESDRRTPFGNQLILLLVEVGISAEES
jgi:hypothetical protein